MLIINWLKLPLRIAHEAYVLSPEQINIDKQAAKLNPWQALAAGGFKAFVASGLLISSSLAAALYLKSRPFWQRVGRSIDRATWFAPDIIRVSLGLSLIFAAHYHAVFGPELPVANFNGQTLIEPFLFISGVALVAGLFSRLMGGLVAAFWLYCLADQGWYLLTYLNYFGEAVALVLISQQKISLDSLIFGSKTSSSADKWAMPVARILFGLALLYAAINVKFVTAAASLNVVNQYDLTRYLPFDPSFVVLGAGLVEILIAALFLLGLLQRLNSMLFIGFMAASLLFFREAVWPHLLLLGLAAGIFLHKPDRLALDGRLFGKTGR